MIIITDTDLDGDKSAETLYKAFEKSGLLGVPLYDTKAHVRRRLFMQLWYYWNIKLGIVEPYDAKDNLIVRIKRYFYENSELGAYIDSRVYNNDKIIEETVMSGIKAWKANGSPTYYDTEPT